MSEIASKLFVSKKVFAINKQRYEIIPFLQFFAIMEYVEIVVSELINGQKINKNRLENFRLLIKRIYAAIKNERRNYNL